MEKVISIHTRPLQPSEQKSIFNNMVEVLPRANLPMFCVDGRKGPHNGEGPYFQGLGGSYHLIALNWLLNRGGSIDFTESAEQTLTSMKSKNMRIGVHRGAHKDGETKSDCGFADNFAKIVKTLQNNRSLIWDMLTKVKMETSLKDMKNEWNEIMDSIQDAKLNTVPPGEALISMATEKYKADVQDLEGDHGEIAAMVNLKPNTTLDVDNNQATQAFNLDLWKVLEQAKELGINEQKATLLSLGLYVATEMVLVEEKRKIRLPIIVNE